AKEALPPLVKRSLAGYLQVPRILDEDDVLERVSAWLRGRVVDRVLTNWEPLVLLAARMRERWQLPGMTVDVTLGFRDKQLMKERVAAAGLRVPRSERVTRAGADDADHQVRAAAEKVGFPLILKPIAGAGSADTYLARDAAELDVAIKR